MKHYRILSADNEDTLAEYVEEALNDGWELADGFRVVYNSQLIYDDAEPSVIGLRFYQPIAKVKRAESPTRMPFK